MEEAIVLYPSPAIGHLISMVEFGKLILVHRPSLSIHIFIISMPYNAGSIDPYIATVSATIPSINFHHLPAVTLPSTATKHHETLAFEALSLSNSNLHQALLSISKSYSIYALLLDFFCTSALSVASELNIPGYLFFTSPAAFLAFFLYFPALHQSTTKSFKDLNDLLHIPGLPPIPSSDVAMPLLERDDKAYQYFLDSSIRFPEYSGIIVNTFESLESRAIKAISDGLCVLGNPTPPLYCIGPLIAADDRRGGVSRVPECLTWLDSQPSQSVVFLCFGSLGLFSIEQLREIAVGLEKSEQRFMWVVRSPPSNRNRSLAISKLSEPDLDLLLPEGFLERTKERGLVVKSWAPQVAVLNHKSVGGFVTHCGWNSVLEAVCAGVPMVAWPLYAEQRFNRVLLVEEMKLALPINESSTENGLVTASEVEKRVRDLMDLSEEGRMVRERVVAMKNAAKAALSEGGSSQVALTKLVSSWVHG